MSKFKNENKIKNTSDQELSELLILALNANWAGYSIWRAIRDSHSRIMDFKLIYSNEISNNPVKSITGKILHKPISEVVMNGDTERIKSGFRKALMRYQPKIKISNAEIMDGWVDGSEITVFALTKDDVFVGYQEGNHNYESLSKTQWLFDHDPLTGLIDEVLLEEMLNEALLNLQKYGKRFAFGILDLDDFYKVNSKHGRQIGDLTLRKFAETFKAELQQKDRLIRLGEDDFAVIMQDVNNLSEITELSKRIMSVCNAGWNINGSSIHLSFSAGFTLVQDQFATTQEIFQLAQSQMFKVKNHGKNGFVSSIFHGLVRS